MSWILSELGWSLKVNSLEIQVNKSGGRLQSSQFKGIEFLEQKAEQTGNTFWTSPQSEWEWPPLSEHDSDDYQGMIDKNILRLRSKVDTKLNLRIIKEYSILEGDVLKIKYGIVNQGNLSTQVAPWEITRVPALGKTYFKPAQNNPSWGELSLESEGEYLVLNHKNEDKLKYFGFDSEGLIVHEHSGIKLEKFSKNASPENAAPGESGIEIYAAPDYVEVEQQGAYETLEPGAILWWDVKWRFSQV